MCVEGLTFYCNAFESRAWCLEKRRSVKVVSVWYVCVCVCVRERYKLASQSNDQLHQTVF